MNGILSSYLVLGVPILALTATATPHVQQDICSSLKLKDPQEIMSKICDLFITEFSWDTSEWKG